MTASTDQLRDMLLRHCDDLTADEAETLGSLIDHLRSMSEQDLAAIENPVLNEEATKLRAIIDGETDE